MDSPQAPPPQDDRDDVRRHLRSSSQPLYISPCPSSCDRDRRWPMAGRRQLPTIAEMSGRYGVARVTVRQALGELAAEGLIASLQGKGTFVRQIQKPKSVQLGSSWRISCSRSTATCRRRCMWRRRGAAGADGGEGGPATPTATCSASTAARAALLRHRSVSRQRLLRPRPEQFRQMVIPLLGRLTGNDMQKMAIVSHPGRRSVRRPRTDLPLRPIGEVRRVITNRRDQIVYLGIAKYRGDMVVFNTTIEVPR